MLITQKGQKPPVRAKLLRGRLLDGEEYAAGDIVEMSARDFKYLEQFGFVEAAPVKAK